MCDHVFACEFWDQRYCLSRLGEIEVLNEFRDLIARGNVMDMAVGIIIGAEFTSIIASFVGNLANPLIGRFLGRVNFTDM